MSGRLKLITGPVGEPVLPEDVRLYGRISSDVTDATLNLLIASARQEAEGYQNRAYIAQTWELVFDSFPICPIRIPLPPLISLVSVAITDISGTVTAMSLTDFIVDSSGANGSINLKYGKNWPSVIPEYAGVVIRFTAGYGDSDFVVPDRVKTAIILGAVYRYDNPGGPMPDAFFMELDLDKIQTV